MRVRRISLATTVGGIATALAHLAGRTSEHRVPHSDETVRPGLRAVEDYLAAAIEHDAIWGDRVATDLVEFVRQQVAEITGLADHLYGMNELDCREADLAGEPYIRLDDLRWLLGGYVLRGSRIQRLIQLPSLIGALDPDAASENSYAALRSAAAELLDRIRATNGAVADWLLLHRVALPDPDVFDSNALFDRYGRLQLDPCSVSADPLYLLTCHLHDVLETADAVDDPDHPALQILEAQLTRPLAAVDEEITAVMTFNAALATLARALRPAPTEA